MQSNDSKIAASDFRPADRPGPYRSGALRTTFIDRKRNRKLPAIIWYPTDDQNGKPMSYLAGLVRDEGAIKSARIAVGGPFPLVVFSHGIGAINFQSYFLMNHLASHGYIVVAPNHRQSSALTYSGKKYFAKSAVDRPQDISLVIDQMLARSDDPENFFYQKVDRQKIGVTGHSFGGYTTIASLGPPLDVAGMREKCAQFGESDWTGEWIFCRDLAKSDLSYVEDCHPCAAGDERIKAAVALAPAFPYLIAPGGLAQIDVPLLIVAGELDEITPPETQVHLYFEGLVQPDSLYLELARANHFSFSSACEIAIAQRFFPCGPEYLEASSGYAHIRTATVAFFGRHILGDERYRRYFAEDYLAKFPEITLENKTNDPPE